MDWEPDVTSVSQRGPHDQVFNALRHALAQATGSKWVLAYLQTLAGLPLASPRRRGDRIA